ncbi:MAG: hypothetical protein KDC71_24015 [Acidobacteria bacterium]|nr:hypothetical protein [Acidobacteriota bacterium]
MQSVALNVINQSNDQNNSEIVIFQKNVATTFDEIAVAWRVIRNLGRGDYHPFTFPLNMTVGSSDSWGNFTPQLDAYPGQAFQMTLQPSGDVLSYQGAATSPTEVQVNNNLPSGAINANIFKNGKLLATKTSIAPGQKAVFEFKPTIFIGVVSQVQEGQIMNSAIISQINTEISLLGIASADIVLTGGGPGPNSSPFEFSLNNVVMA